MCFLITKKLKKAYNTNKEMNVVIGCIDPRATREISGLVKQLQHDAPVTTIRIAGGMVPIFGDWLAKNAQNISKIMLVPHDNGCAGAKSVWEALTDGNGFSSNFYGSFVEPFRLWAKATGASLHSAVDVENSLPAFHADLAARILGSNGFTGEIESYQMHVQDAHHGSEDKLFLVSNGENSRAHAHNLEELSWLSVNHAYVSRVPLSMSSSSVVRAISVNLEILKKAHAVSISFSDEEHKALESALAFACRAAPGVTSSSVKI